MEYLGGRKWANKVVIYHGYRPSFWNCNFPSFCGAEEPLRWQQAAHYEPNSYKLLPPSLLVFYWGPGAFGFAAVVRSFMIADVGRNEQSFMHEDLLSEVKNTSKTSMVEELLFSNWKKEADLGVRFTHVSSKHTLNEGQTRSLFFWKHLHHSELQHADVSSLVY